MTTISLSSTAAAAGTTWRTRVRDPLSTLLLAILPFATFWRLWAPNGDDRVMFAGDLLVGGYPTREFVHEALISGRVPSWNAYQLGGMPLLGDVQVAPFYLPNLLLDVIYWGRSLPYVAVELLVVGHMALAGVLMYGLCRHLGIGPAAALVGGIAFELNGFFVGHHGHYNMMAVVVWIPGAVWAASAVARSLTWRRTALATAALSVCASQMVMAGHPQATLYSGTVVGAWCVWLWIRAWRADGPVRGLPWRRRHAHPALRMPIIFGGAGALALGVSAIALLPMQELLGRSLRSDLDYDFASQFSMLPRNLVGLVSPDLFDWSGTEFRIYAGLTTLVLVAVALSAVRQPDPTVRFMVVLAIGGVVLSLGAFTAFHGILYRFVPGYADVRVSARAFLATNFALALLAAYGTETLVNSDSSEHHNPSLAVWRAGRWIMGMLGLVAATCYVLLFLNYRPATDEFYFAENLFPGGEADTYASLTHTANAVVMAVALLGAALTFVWAVGTGRLRGPAIGIVAATLVALDLMSVATRHDVVDGDPTHATLNVADFAIVFLDDWEAGEQQQIIDTLQAAPAGVRVENTAQVLPSNFGTRWGIPFSTGYNVLELQERSELISQWPELPDSLERDLLSVGYVLTQPDGEAPEDGAELVVENGQGKVWRLPGPTAQAWFSGAVRPAATSITVNGLLNVSASDMFAQPALSADEGTVRAALRGLWLDEVAVDDAWAVGTTGTRSPVDISVLSGGSMRYSAIVVDGVTVTPDEGRGVIVATIDPTTGAASDALIFDTYLSAAEVDRFSAHVQSIPEGSLVAVATVDEATTRLDDAAVDALRSLGGQHDLRGRTGEAYALVGVKGAGSGTALEAFSDTPVTVDVGTALRGDATASADVRVVRWSEEEVVVSVDNAEPGIVTVSEAFYPGREVYVNGVRSTQLRSNGMLAAVAVPAAPGDVPNEIVFRYEPSSVSTGAIISLSSVAGLVGLVVSGLLGGARVAADGAPVGRLRHLGRRSGPRRDARWSRVWRGWR